MFGGEAFGSQSFGSTGDALVVVAVCPPGIDIDDICTATDLPGQSIDDLCECIT